MLEMSDTHKREMMGVILAFLSQNGFERSYKVVLDEIRDQMPSLEPSADILQQRHAAPIKHVETAHFFFLAGRSYMASIQQSAKQIADRFVLLTKNDCFDWQP
jgi:hypothetical protein